MAVKTIAELAAATSLADTDVFIIDDGSRNYKITWGILKNLLGTVSSFTADNTTGTITITLATGATMSVTPHDPTKQDVLTFDATPTLGSSNPVTSGGVKLALNSLRVMIAPEYSSEKTYDVEDYVIYDDKLYRCTTAISIPEAWNIEHWVRTYIGHELRYRLTLGPIANVQIEE